LQYVRWKVTLTNVTNMSLTLGGMLRQRAA
jgi:hypothetical protein